MDQAKWTYPVYRLFQGELNLADVIAKAANSKGLCETIFCVGEWHLLQGDADDTRQKSQAALLPCSIAFVEYDVQRVSCTGSVRNSFLRSRNRELLWC